MNIPLHFSEMKRCFDDLAADLKSAAADRLVLYIGNPGNRGDALIRYGTKLFLSDHNIEHVEQNIDGPQGRLHVLPYISPTFPKRVLFLIGGGGAWSHAYPAAYRLAKMLVRARASIFVLPSTYEFSPKGIRGTLYRRDEFQSKDAAPDSKFCHDMAFYAAMRRDHLGFFRMPVTKPIGTYFRNDLEGRFKIDDLPKDNYDISAAGRHLHNADDFIRELAASHSNLTDRLHVAVGSLAAKRKVFLMTGNYFKIRAIYESSMRPFFENEIVLADDSESLSSFIARSNTCIRNSLSSGSSDL